MLKTIKKTNMIFISILLVIVCGFVYCTTDFLNAKQTTESQVMVRNIEINKNEIDYQSILDEFEDSKLETKGALTTFEGYKTLNLAELDGFDLVSDTDIEDTEVSVKYNFSYDNETNIVTLSAELKDELGEIYVDTLTGAAFINEDGEIDAVMNVDGEGILLSEMQDAGMIQNCGWFSRLIKKVVKVVAIAVVVGIVATAVVVTAGAIVGAAAAAAPAVVAAGVGVIGTSASVGVATGTAIAAGVAAAAVTASVGIGVAIGETIADSREEAKAQTYTDTIADTSNKKVVIFPLIPETFAPRGLIMKIYSGTSNGRFIKWFDASGIMIFEWDEDLTHGSHYHIMAHDGLHYLPGTIVPEPYASMYF